MTYSPNNLGIFSAAYEGALGSVNINTAKPTDPNPADYQIGATIAGAFAQSFDAIWGAKTASSLDIACVFSCSEVLFLGMSLSPENLPAYAQPATWTPNAQAIYAIVIAAELYFASQGITPIPTSSGGIVYSSPTTLVVDPTNTTGKASDTNPGTALLPWLTVARLNQALAGATIEAAVVVALLGDELSSDALLNLSTTTVTTAIGGNLNFVGTAQVLHSGTLTSGTTTFNPATNQREIAEDTTLGSNGFLPFEKSFLSDLTGGNAGAVLTIASHVASTARANCSVPTDLNQDTRAIASGDAYQIFRGSKLKVGRAVPTTDDPSGFEATRFTNFDFIDTTGGTANEALVPAFLGGNFFCCRFFDPLQAIGVAELTNCALIGQLESSQLPILTYSPASLSIVFGGLLIGGFGGIWGVTEVTGNCYCTGQAFAIEQDRPEVILGNVQFQDCTDSEGHGALHIEQGADVDARDVALWGNGNQGVGVYLFPNCTFRSGAPGVTLTGTSGDFTYGANPTAPSYTWNGSAYTGPITNTWAHLIANVNLHDLAGNTHLFYGD